MATLQIKACPKSNKKLNTCGLKFSTKSMKYITDCPPSVMNEIQQTDNVNKQMHNEDNIIFTKANY